MHDVGVVRNVRRLWIEAMIREGRQHRGIMRPKPALEALVPCEQCGLFHPEDEGEPCKACREGGE